VYTPVAVFDSPALVACGGGLSFFPGLPRSPLVTFLSSLFYGTTPLGLGQEGADLRGRGHGQAGKTQKDVIFFLPTLLEELIGHPGIGAKLSPCLRQAVVLFQPNTPFYAVVMVYMWAAGVDSLEGESSCTPFVVFRHLFERGPFSFPFDFSLNFFYFVGTVFCVSFWRIAQRFSPYCLPVPSFHRLVFVFGCFSLARRFPPSDGLSRYFLYVMHLAVMM